MTPTQPQPTNIPPQSVSSSSTLSKRKLWLARLMVLGLSLVFGFVACEILARILYGAPLPQQLPMVAVQANKTRGWEMLPNSTHYTYHHRVEVNSLGFRGPEVQPKAEGEFRVLALGDSHVYGQGVADEDTLTSQMERMLAEGDSRKASRYSVINTGHQAYSTNQELYVLREHGSALAPDVVVLYWFWNDIGEWDDNELRQGYELLTERGPVAHDLMVKPEGWPLLKWRAKEMLRRSAVLMVAYDGVRDWRAPGFPGEKAILASMKRLDGYLAEFKSLSEQGRFQFLVVVVPDANSLMKEHPSEAVGRQVEEIAARHGIRVMNPLKPLRDHFGSDPKKAIIPYDGHYNGEALGVLARYTVKEIVQLP